MKVLSLDFETSIGTTIQGPTFRDPKNDIYTIIYATHPDKVNVHHSENGFNREVRLSAAFDLQGVLTSLDIT